MNVTAQPTVIAERRGQVLLLTLNRPEVRNAFNLAMAQRMEAEIDRFEADAELRVAIITGGPAFFCAGVDLRAAASGERPRTAQRGWFGLNEKPPLKPLIAAVEGPALAGGLELALACDLMVASRASVFGLPEVSRGLIASAGGLIRLPRKLPAAMVAEIALTGAPVSAERLYALGLVNRLSEPGVALAAALELAERIAANAPLSVVATKRVLATDEAAELAAAWQRQDREFEQVRNSADYREGIAAFLEKRPPRFNGR
jgi:acetyl-CoA C-acetyltransferase